MRILVLLPLIAAVGCSNAPLAGTLDCLFPSKVGKGNPSPRPDGNTIPPPILPTDPVPSRDRLQSNPREIDRDPWGPLPGDRPSNDGKKPEALPAPGFLEPAR